MTTPLIPVSEPVITGNELAYVSECITSGWISSLGSFVQRFEQVFAERYGMPYALTVCNGTAALHLGLMAAGIGSGDEVIVPAMTFVATANAVAYTGAKPVFVDADPVYWNMDHSLLESAITPKTRAIMPVHLFGQVADMDLIRGFARKHQLIIIEDTAEAQEGKWGNQYAGSFGDLSTFSFYGNKLISTGEGGMLLLRDRDQYQRAKLLRDHAMDPLRRYYHPEIGYNYRMTNIQAALGVAQMEYVDATIARKTQIAQWYLKELKGVSGIQLPQELPGSRHAHWLFSIVIESSLSIERDELIMKLRKHGVDSRPFFHPMPDLPAYADQGKNREFPVARWLGSRGLSLPSSPLLTQEQVRFICSTLCNILEAHS
jgi:perosamine synthetase